MSDVRDDDPAGSPAPDTLLVSTRKGLFSLVPTDGRWTVERVAFLGERVTVALADPRDGAWYAALDLGHFGAKLQRSDDRGRTWTEVAIPAYPEDATIVTGDGKDPQPATLKLLWSLEAGGPDQPGRLWAGTIPGGLFCSDDRGESWHLVRGLWDRPERPEWFGGGYDGPGIHSICVDPRDSKALHIAISCGGVLYSDDDGATWTARTKGMIAGYMPPERQEDPNIQDPHRLVRCPGAPDQLWVQHHSGVFHSADAGRAWRAIDVPPSSFGFAVAVHPRDPKTAWFVPAIKDEKRVPVDGALCVARTRDGGETFEVLRAGLPQTHAYDLIYRHGLAIDATGKRLAFGSTTGSLWTTDDQGDHWQAVSHHLPPIHAVCFA